MSSIVNRSKPRIVVAVLLVVAAIAAGISWQPSARAVEFEEGVSGILIDAIARFVTSDDLGQLGIDAPLLNAAVTPVLDNGDAGLYSPFKAPLTYDADASATASISHTFAMVVNPAPTNIVLPYEATSSVGYADAAIRVGANLGELPPLMGDGAGMTFEEFGGYLATGLGLDSDGMGSIAGMDVYGVFPETPTGTPLGGNPVFLLGARTEAPRTFECPGVFREFGVFFDTPLPNWDDTTGADSAAFNDFFYAGDSALANACGDDGVIESQNLIVFQGSGASPPFGDAPGSGIHISGPYGWVSVVNGGDVPGAQGVRWFEFLTDQMAPGNPDYTVASATPADLTTLLPLGSTTHLYFDETLIPAETTTTSQAVITESTTTTGAASTTTAEATTTTVAAIDVPADGSSFPFPILIFLGLAIIAFGIWLWWRNWTLATVTTATATITTAPPTSTPPPSTTTVTTIDDDTAVVVPPAVRPGKGVGTDGDSPPLVGLRGWKL